MYPSWALDNRGRWPDLDAREVPRDGMATWAVGFVLADPFDTILRQLSPAYLLAAWRQLDVALVKHHLVIPDLFWGNLYSGLTRIPGLEADAPSNFTGLISRKIAHWIPNDWDSLYLDHQLGPLDAELGRSHPPLRLAATSESSQWLIAPDEVALASRLVEALWTDEVSDWAPSVLLRGRAPDGEPWLEIAQAILDEDQQQLDRSAAAARAQYSPLGYRIVVRGYNQFLRDWKLPLHLLEPDR